MMIMTAKVDFKKIIIVLAAVVGVILAMVLLLGGKETAQTAAPAADSNDGRVKLLEELGWQVSASPVEAGKVRIPEQPSELFSRYNDLQKSQGYDLSQYAGQTVMRYVYKVNNYPGATEPVYATLLVHKDKVIGGDVTDTGAKGVVQSLQQVRPQATEPSAATEPPASTAPSQS